MKKIKLTGVKEGWFGRKVKKHIADLYVQDGKVVLDSKYKGSKELEEEINEAANREVFRKKYGDDSREEGPTFWMTSKKPEDPDFLGALRDTPGFFLGKKLGKYEVNMTLSKIVEE